MAITRRTLAIAAALAAAAAAALLALRLGREPPSDEERIRALFDDAARATSAQVHELVRYVQQSNPQLVTQLFDILARDTATITALGASVAALTVQRLAAAQGRRRED